MAKLADLVGRDISVISRQLQKISQQAPVLEKRQGKWQLSPIGAQINHWARDAAEAQKRILSQSGVLRIASTREFSARVLSPQLPEFLKGENNIVVSLLTSERGVEHLLLKGKADIGFDCGRPQDPSIRFKTAKSECFAIVAAPSFLKKYNVKAAKQVFSLPHLQYKRATAPQLLHLPFEVPLVFASFDDIASIRAACEAGVGWAVLPLYAIQAELDAGLLQRVPGWKIEREQFGVWWLRGNKSLEPWVNRALSWLRSQQFQ
ncbi:MAG: LysR family transcriptional regulator [Bdellovibrionaceae bacterium]|nr:LysR family transcriptional regulator [Bdellovibrionales bacterium]MCB9253347.1 LysR family transcriptional regulator [Pseudobdellovibrionaceae bacterium]